MDLETAARKRREKAGGKERVHESGLAIVRNAEDRRRAEQLARRIDAWKRESSFDEQVDLASAARAPLDDHMRSILDACED